MPTMIAGFWGMNMPVPGENGVSFLETGWFWLVIAATAVLTAAIAVFIVRGNPLKRAQRQKRRRRRDKKDKNK